MFLSFSCIYLIHPCTDYIYPTVSIYPITLTVALSRSRVSGF